jgi:hypothetical protein
VTRFSIVLSKVFFLKVDGCRTEGLRWQDGVGSLNFTWLRAPCTATSCFDSVALFDCTPEERLLMSRSMNVSKRKSFFSRAAEEEEDEELVNAQRQISARREKMLEKVALSQGVHSWVLCPFRF